MPTSIPGGGGREADTDTKYLDFSFSHLLNMGIGLDWDYFNLASPQNLKNPVDKFPGPFSVLLSQNHQE